MPNGNPFFGEEELPQLERFFAPAADVLTAFARDRNLKLDKYYHEGHNWSFVFRHPKDGVGQIQVQKCGENAVRVYGMWGMNNWENYTRSSRHQLFGEYKIDDAELRPALEEALRRIVSWPLGEWTQVFGGYEEIWGRHTEEERAFMQEHVRRYPMPRLE